MHRLTPEQKEAFVALAYRMVIADGRLKEGENDHLKAIRAQAGFQGPVPAFDVLGDTLPEVFDDHRCRIAVLIELLMIAIADGELHPRELHQIHETAQAFGIDAEEISRLEDWARDYGRLHARAVAMMG